MVRFILKVSLTKGTRNEQIKILLGLPKSPEFHYQLMLRRPGFQYPTARERLEGALLMKALKTITVKGFRGEETHMLVSQHEFGTTWVQVDEDGTVILHSDRNFGGTQLNHSVLLSVEQLEQILNTIKEL